MKQPVVLQVLPQLRTGGVERGTVEIAGAIKRAGWKPLVTSEGGGQMISNLSYVGGEHIPLPLASKNPFRIWRNAAAIANLIKEHGVDIVHARSRAPAWSAYLAAKRTKTPFVTTFHGVYGLEPPIKKHYNAVMTKGDRVIAISHFVAKHITDHYTMNPERLRTIHRGVDLAQFDPARTVPQRIVELAARWRVPDDLPIIMLPGRISRWKGHHVLVQALSGLNHRKFFCLIVGDDLGHPNYRQEIERSASEAGLEGHIRFVGNTPHMAEAYMLADIVVAPSIEPEAFGRVPIEAQAMGRLVIATDHGGACETVVDGVTGWRVTPNNAGSLASAIEHALNLPETEKERIGRQATGHVQEHFSAEIMCKKTLDVYWELIGKKYE